MLPSPQKPLHLWTRANLILMLVKIIHSIIICYPFLVQNKLFRAWESWLCHGTAGNHADIWRACFNQWGCCILFGGKGGILVTFQLNKDWNADITSTFSTRGFWHLYIYISLLYSIYFDVGISIRSLVSFPPFLSYCFCLLTIPWNSFNSLSEIFVFHGFGSFSFLGLLILKFFLRGTGPLSSHLKPSFHFPNYYFFCHSPIYICPHYSCCP